jgi:hypothetical protein
MRIGLIAPPWIPVPPPAYGGIESIVDVLARGLAAAGDEVLLAAAAGSTCPVPLQLWVMRSPPMRGPGPLCGRNDPCWCCMCGHFTVRSSLSYSWPPAGGGFYMKDLFRRYRHRNQAPMRTMTRMAPMTYGA